VSLAAQGRLRRDEKEEKKMAQIIDKVQPGDLITAQFINRIVDEINALQAKVAGLEAVGPAGGKVYITEILPHSPSPRVNQVMHIVGQNFGFLIGATEVMLDHDVRVDKFLPNSNDQNLIFKIPVIQNLPPKGRPVNVRVSNVKHYAEEVVTILPAELKLEGGVDVLFKSANPVTITPNNPVTFEFNLKSRASLAADFTITTEITGIANPSPWEDQIEVLNNFKIKAPDNRIPLNVNETKTFFVRIPAVPPNTNGVKFGLKVTASSGTVSGFDIPANFVVGQAVVPPDPDTNLILNTGAASVPVEFIPPAAGTLKLSTTPATIVLQKPTAEVPSPLARVNLTAAIRAIGSYILSAKITSGSGWTATVNTGQVPNPVNIKEADFGVSDEVTKPLRIIVKALAAATAQAEVEIQFQREGSSLKQTMRLKLALPAHG
jgi:hypothetical protein